MWVRGSSLEARGMNRQLQLRLGLKHQASTVLLPRHPLPDVEFTPRTLAGRNRIAAGYLHAHELRHELLRTS
jgi:hypothetical protein